MGMFDSFLIDIDGRTHELQTKRFACELNTARLGEVLGGAPAGVQAYFHRGRLTEQGWLDYDVATEDCTLVIYIVLVHGVFTACEIARDGFEDTAVLQRLAELKTHWSDSGRVLATWAEFIARSQAERNELHGRIQSALSVIDYARATRSDRTENKLRDAFKCEPEKRIDQGENIVDVVQACLRQEISSGFGPSSIRTTPEVDQFAL